MGQRRRKSNEAALFEAVTGFATIGLILWFFSPEFRHWVQVILVLLAAGFVVVLVAWMIWRTTRPKLTSPYRTITQEQQPILNPIRNKLPTIGEEMQSVQFTPEPTISEKLRKIDWFQFEKLIGMIYEHRGFTVKRLGGANSDGGVDLIVESPTEKLVVQCKHWRKWTVGVRHIREFLGTLTDSKISKGIFITLVGYSDDAKQLADKHGIQILDEADITNMLAESGLMYSKEFSKLFSDDRKFCPKCENVMVLRTAKVKGNQFWGCSNYPRCRSIVNV
jgi:hypothetical protein